MTDRDAKGILAGLLVSATGVFFVVNALKYDFGTPLRMGPGFFPVVIGAVTILCGFTIAGPALRRSGEWPKLAWRPLVFVSLSIALFGLALPYLGLIPALFITVFVSAFSEKSPSLVQTTLLAAITSVSCWLLFVVLLGVDVRAFGGGRI